MADLFSWPESPPAPTEEQRELPLPGTAEERFAAWRGTPDGERAYTWMRDEARREVAYGTRRLSAKSLVERCRALHRVKINNSWTPLIARAIQADLPATRGLFKDRMRRVA